MPPADSLFYGQGDDAIDFHTRSGLFVDLMHNGTDWVLRYAVDSGMGEVYSGEALEIFNPSAGQSHCFVFAKENLGQSCGTLGDRNLQCLKVENAGCPNTVGFNGSNKSTSDWVNNVTETWDDAYQIPTIIENNLFFGSRGRAILNRGWNTIIRNNDIGDWYYGTPSFGQGIVEGICASDFNYPALGHFNWPGRDSQQIYWNYGVFGNRVDFCIAADYPQSWQP